MTLSTTPTDITFGTKGDYVATIASASTGATATGVQLTVAPPTILNAALGIGQLTVTGGSACTTDENTGVMTCTVPDILVGQSADVAFSVNLPVPQVPELDASGNPVTDSTGTIVTVIPTDPAFCPNDTAGGTVLGPVTASVSSTNTTTITQAAPAVTTVRNYADLAATLDGPTGASQGQTVTYDATITNNGPCTSINVFVDTTVGAGLLFQSGDGACTTDAQCSLGDMAPGASASFKKTYKVDTLRNNLTSTGDPNGIAVHSGDSSDPTAVIAGTDDPDDSNDAPSTATFVQSGAGGGCSSAGSAAPWAIAVLGLLALSLRRRRAA